MTEDPSEAGLDRRELLARGAAGALALAGWRLLPAAAAGGWTSSARDLAASRHAPRAPRGLNERWRLAMAGGVPGTPALVGDRVIGASLGGEVLAADLETGRVARGAASPPSATATAIWASSGARPSPEGVWWWPRTGCDA